MDEQQDDTQSSSDAKRLQHMKRRKAHGLTYRELEGEFGLGKSTIHRKLTEHEQED